MRSAALAPRLRTIAQLMATGLKELPLIILYLMTERQCNGRKYNNDTLKRTGIVFYDIQSRSRLSLQTISLLIVYNLETTKSNKHCPSPPFSFSFSSLLNRDYLTFTVQSYVCVDFNSCFYFHPLKGESLSGIPINLSHS